MKSDVKASNGTGKFIVFEGIDGAGSTTQTNLLFEYLKSKNRSVTKTCEPTDGPVGRLIRRALNHELNFSWETLQLLYTADRADHLEKTIKPALFAGTTVLSDRYFFSTYAYGELNLGRQWLRIINSNFPMPDVTFLIDTPVDVAMKRMSARSSKELFEKEKVLNKVRKNYLDIAKEFGFVILDGLKSKEKVFEEVLITLNNKLSL